MTDEQIIKAFEVYYEQDNDMLLTKEAKKAILDLIKRQQAEIEHFRDLTKKIKTEAIKEFAERLKKKGTPVTGGKGFEGVYVMCSNIAIDNLVKELTQRK